MLNFLICDPPLEIAVERAKAGYPTLENGDLIGKSKATAHPAAKPDRNDMPETRTKPQHALTDGVLLNRPGLGVPSTNGIGRFQCAIITFDRAGVRSSGGFRHDFFRSSARLTVRAYCIAKTVQLGFQYGQFFASRRQISGFRCFLDQ